jgi:diaminopropionate ammonia-lyase
MTQTLPEIAIDIFHNPRSDKSRPYGEERRLVLSEEEFTRARNEIAAWPGYSPTPLLSLNGLADAIGIGQLSYKDESVRFELASFKALGGAYAVAHLLAQEVQRLTLAESITTDDLLGGSFREFTGNITVTCATDGNHGRSVAWGAQLFGCRCIIYIHATVSAGREQAIADYGAEVVRVEGNYDDAVREADVDAGWYGRILISDTSYPGYTDIPRYVMQGYTVMVDEAIQQLPGGQQPTHIFVQGGVGGLAAAVCSLFWERYGERRPRFIVVEPKRADCIFQSISQGQRQPSKGDLNTLMAGLACGEVSLLAWDILNEGIDDVITVDDKAAEDCMRILAAGCDDDPPVVAGESAVAGLAGLIGVLQQPDLRARLQINSDSRVLLFGTEGATDPMLYRQITGYGPAEVLAGKAGAAVQQPAADAGAEQPGDAETDNQNTTSDPTSDPTSNNT